MPPLLRILVLLCGLPSALCAQSLEQRISAAGSGVVRMSFISHPGVCASSTHDVRSVYSDEQWEEDCEPQPIRVVLSLTDGRVTGVRTYVGGRWRPRASVVDLGMVRPQDAAPYLVSLAERTGVAGDPLFPAVLADSVTIWPSLLRLAGSALVTSDTRRSAVFWLAEAAGAAITPALDSIAGDVRGDREVRKQAVFALSQRTDREAIPALIRIARANQDPALRKTALFWLGQSGDPRALALFEEILR
jgi:hypothetical protein